MIAAALRVVSYSGVALLIVDGSSLALWSVVVTSVASLIAQQMKAREDRMREERRHRYEAEDRQAAFAARAALSAGLAENTALTREASTKADAAYDTANHINEKIASLAIAERERYREALDRVDRERAGAVRDRDAIRGDIAENTVIAREAAAKIDGVAEMCRQPEDGQ